MNEQVEVRTRVSLPPEAAFALFTDQVDAWWKRGTRYRRLADSTVRFTDSLLIEEGEHASRVIARVVGWDSPHGLALDMDGDPVAIEFAAVDGGGTEVVVRQAKGRGLTAFQSAAGLFWADLLSALGVRSRRPR